MTYGGLDDGIALHRARLLSLVAQFGMRREVVAALLRQVADELDPPRRGRGDDAGDE